MIATQTFKATFLSIFALTGVPASSQPSGELLPASEMREKHDLTAENQPVIHLDASKVPEDLVDLIPFARKWGIEDDLIREDVQSKSSQKEKQALADALRGRNARITEWLDAQPKGAQMTDEAAAFMYMQLGLDEMGLLVD